MSKQMTAAEYDSIKSDWATLAEPMADPAEFSFAEAVAYLADRKAKFAELRGVSAIPGFTPATDAESAEFLGSLFDAS